ncbi:hypothetical protein FGU65_05810 [Methanoculleus sp. FWC-SCC1]|uniref:Uncharacterized protein n=2 Tax=Methanoculleus frigidifontis TaxID=2584085 RepID=A0ABT8M914_9EURY|nr:hypothetical protein [Methanoculleus sp. FWC-SCC1]
MFARLIEDCGTCCEAITPHMLASPFYRGRFVSLIIPTGFGNADYSNLLPALRASQGRIRRFVENGGNLLIFGAGTDRPDAYDWLPFDLRYHHTYGPRPVRFREEDSRYASIIQGYDPRAIECDGSFTGYDAEAIATDDGGCAIVLEKTIQAGTVLVTSIHEYPSRAFLASFSCADRETLF